MGSFTNGVYVPTIGEVGWGTNVNDFLTRSGEEYINVKQSPYAARGDTTLATYLASTAHDDTTALQAAFNAAAGGTCVIPPGRYYVSSTLVIPTGTTIRGMSIGDEGAYDTTGTRIWGAAALTGPILRVAGSSMNVAIRDLVLAGGAGHRIFLDGDSGHTITHTIIDNVWVQGGDATHWGVKAVWGLETHIERCRFTACLGGGIYLGDTCNGSTIRDNTMSNEGNGALGGVLIEANGCLIEGNVIEAWRGAYGIKMDGAVGYNMAFRNWIEDDNGVGIWVTGSCFATSIIGNNTSPNGSSTYSLKVDSCRGAYLAGNLTAGSSVADVALTSTAAANAETTAVLAGNYIGGTGAGGRISLSGLLNAKDSVVRFSDGRRDDVTTGAPPWEVMVGDARMGASSKLQWASAIDSANDTNLYRQAANTLATDDAFRVSVQTHANLSGGVVPPASFVAGSMVYCSTDKKPVWSDGSAHWVDAAGANHT